METTENIVNIAYLNWKGQTGFNDSKQLQTEKFMKSYDIDILHLQECHVEENTFTLCKFIMSDYNIIHNNSNTKYGTASLVKTSLAVEDVQCQDLN